MFRLRVLGGFALDGPGGTPVSDLPHRRAMAVLAVLAVCGDLGCTRDRLLALLWPESDEAHARHGLRDALHAIRHALTPRSIPSIASLLRLDSSVVGSDVLVFSQAMASGRLTDAVRAYGGPLLEGFHVDAAPEFEYWLSGERARLARECMEALEGLASSAEGTGASAEAARWWGRAVEHDPLNSHCVLHQMQALSAIGDRANAIQVGELHVHRLRREFGMEPDPSVLATIGRLQRGELPGLGNGVPRPTPTAQVKRAATVEGSPHAIAPPSTPSEGRKAIGTPLTAKGRRVRRWVSWAAGAAVVVLAATVGMRRWLRPPVAQVHAPRTAIAVLPFRTLGADSSNAYFAGGLHDELLTRLGKVASLRVVGRVSVGDYQKTSKPLRQIGEELGVGSIVEATVQIDGKRLRVVVQLLDPVTQAGLWVERYDRTLDDAFQVQSDIAQRIVASVGTALTTAEAGVIAAAPTQNADAYQLYLQGLEYRRRPGLLRQNWEIAQQLFERALVLDSSFALAHAALSVVHWAMYALGYDPSATRLERARQEADVALRLAPDLPEGHFARGLARYVGRGDFREALHEFNLGLRGAPNDAELWLWIGRVQRPLGNWDGAFVAFDHARRLDPRNANLFHVIGDTYHYLHRYREAIEAYRHGLALAPDLIQTRLSIAWSYVLWRGELDTLRAVLKWLPLAADPGMGGDPVGVDHLLLLLLERRPDSILSLVRVMRPPVGAEGPPLDLTYWTEPAYRLRGDTAAVRAVLDSAALIRSTQERARPDDRDIHAARGLVLAKLGRRTDALREDRWLAEHNTNRYGDMGGARALILMRVGETDAALAETERVLSGPSVTTAPYVRLDPNWDPIRDDPRFQTLLSKYANPGN